MKDGSAAVVLIERWAYVMLALLILFGGGLTALSQSLARPFACEIGSGKEAWVIPREHSSDKAYVANPSAQILFFPRTAVRAPEAVAKFQFAQACLELQEKPHDACAAIVFLRERGLISRNDLAVLQEYYLYNTRAEDGVRIVKEMHACY